MYIYPGSWPRTYMTKNIYLYSHDQECIFPWQCDVYTKNESRVDCFSACLFFFLAISPLVNRKSSLSETLTVTCPTAFTGIYLTYVIHGPDCDKTVWQWCSNRGPQGPLEWPAKQFSLERKLNTFNHLREFFQEYLLRSLIFVAHKEFLKDKYGPQAKKFEHHCRNILRCLKLFTYKYYIAANQLWNRGPYSNRVISDSVLYQFYSLFFICAAFLHFVSGNFKIILCVCSPQKNN